MLLKKKSQSMNTQIRKMNETNLTGKAEEKRKKSKSHDKQKTYTTWLENAQFITDHDVVKQNIPTLKVLQHVQINTRNVDMNEL